MPGGRLTTSPFFFFFYLLNAVYCQDLSGPVFIQEPPNNVDFSNSTGTEIICQARGSPFPSISWTKSDGTPIGTIPGLRQVLENGNLILPPFRATDYKQEVHAQTYRCQSENELGKIISRDVHVRADGKYVVLPSGELQIRNVTAEDGFKTYKCRTKHRLTGETKLSATAGRLVITEPISGSTPKFSLETKITSLVREVGKELGLACPAQGSPVPSYRWYKFQEGTTIKKPVKLDDRVKQVGGTLIILEAQVEDSGKYLCMVNNSVGGESVETVLTVTAPLSAEVEPKQQVVDYGRSATFKCNYKGNPIKQVYWLKDGVNIGHADKVLRIDSVKKEDKGMYQCFVRNEQESAQATGELKLGGRFDPPEFIKTFQTQVLKGGPSVQMPCIAKGDPMPEVKWFLYDTEIESDISAGVTIGSFEGDSGEVASYLNITQARTKHGGLYKCVASSKVGSVSHEGRLDVHGAPYVRPMEDMKVVAGKTMTVTCPVAGYPISNIVWEREGRQLPINDRQRVFTNGTLIIEDVQRSEDAAAYTCVAKNEGGYSARSDLEVSVMEPPEIVPFDFGSEVVNQKEFAQLSCVVRKGDEPISITWSLKGDVISSDPTMSTNTLGTRMSLLMITSVEHRHSGTYTCRAENPAGVSTYSATLRVNGK